MEEQAVSEDIMPEIAPEEIAMSNSAGLPDQSEAAPAAEETVAEVAAETAAPESAAEEVLENVRESVAPEELTALPPAPATDETDANSASAADPFELAQAMLEQSLTSIATPLGSVRLKQALLHGKVLRSKPEFEDCKALARRHGIPLAEVYAAISKIAGN